jgi:hypothetical protein
MNRPRNVILQEDLTLTLIDFGSVLPPSTEFPVNFQLKEIQRVSKLEWQSTISLYEFRKNVKKNPLTMAAQISFHNFKDILVALNHDNRYVKLFERDFLVAKDYALKKLAKEEYALKSNNEFPSLGKHEKFQSPLHVNVKELKSENVLSSLEVK